MKIRQVVVAPAGYEDVTVQEIGARSFDRHDRLFVLPFSDSLLWAQNTWREPKVFKFKSISEAANHLREIQRNWWLHSTASHRRANLIQKKLPRLKRRSIEFLSPVPQAPMGSWTLLDDETMLYSAQCSSPWPDGEIEFVEDKMGPPSRAYLKLWELFTGLGRYPAKGERVVDLGSAPGGWTWVLDQLGAETLSVDKAPLAQGLALSSRVRYLAESAFALRPEDHPGLKWLFSDVICYPERLYELMLKWEPFVPNMICTIKFQGSTDFATIEKFKNFPGSKMRHLSCNKHELTWWRLAECPH